MTWNNACQKGLCRCAICILGASLVQPLICHHSNDAKWIVGGFGRGQPLLPLGEWLNSIGKNVPSKTVRCQRLVKFEIWKENVSRLDKKYGNEHKLWRSVVEIMAIGSVESKMYFLLWPPTCHSHVCQIRFPANQVQSKRHEYESNQQQHHCRCSGLHTTWIPTSLPCYVTHVLQSLPTPPLNFPKISHWPRRLCSLCPFSNHKVSINHGSPLPQTSFPPTPGQEMEHSGSAWKPATRWPGFMVWYSALS